MKHLNFFTICSLFFVVACSSAPVKLTPTMSALPKDENVKVSREEAGKDCTYVSKLDGRASSIKGTSDDALKDLKHEAANKGANYLVVRQYSDMGTAVTGEAYKCP